VCHVAWLLCVYVRGSRCVCVCACVCVYVWWHNAPSYVCYVTWLLHMCAMWHDSCVLCQSYEGPELYHITRVTFVSCHTYQWVMAHIWRSHVIYYRAHIRRSHVTWHTYEGQSYEGPELYDITRETFTDHITLLHMKDAAHTSHVT